MDGWIFAIFAVAAFVALRSLVVLMRRHRNSYAFSLPRRPRQVSRAASVEPPQPESQSSPTEGTSANGESAS